MQGSPRWSGEGFRNLHPIAPGLRSAVPMPGMLDLLRPKPPRLPGGTLRSASTKAFVAALLSAPSSSSLPPNLCTSVQISDSSARPSVAIRSTPLLVR